MDMENLFANAVSLAEERDYAGALRAFEEIRDDSADANWTVAILCAEAKCLRSLGRFAEAEKRLDEAEGINDDELVRVTLSLNRVENRWHEGKWEEALERLKSLSCTYQGVLASPDHRDLYELVWWRMGILLTKLRRYQEAFPMLREASSFDLSADQRSLLDFETGVCRYRLGDFDQSRQSFLKSISKGSESDNRVFAHYYLGAIYFRQRQYDKALAEFKWCEPHLAVTNIPALKLFAWLAKTYSALGMKDQSLKYESLTKKQ